MFRYSFKILPDRLKLIRLYPCGSLGQSISFVFRVWVGHFAATPQSDIVGIWSHDLSFKVQCFPHFHDKTRSGVVSLCWTEIPDQNMIVNLNILAATIGSFKMLMNWLHFGSAPPPPPHSPLYLPPKEREDKEIALKFPLVLAWLWPMSSMQTPQANSFVCNWEQTSLLTGIC